MRAAGGKTKGRVADRCIADENSAIRLLIGS
jgi:hypothetical protein